MNDKGNIATVSLEIPQPNPIIQEKVLSPEEKILDNKAELFIQKIVNVKPNEVNLIIQEIQLIGAKIVKDRSETSNLLLKDPIKNSAQWFDKNSSNKSSIDHYQMIVNKLTPKYKRTFIEFFTLPKKFNKRYEKLLPQLNNLEETMRKFKQDLMLDAQNLNVEQCESNDAAESLTNDVLYCKMLQNKLTSYIDGLSDVEQADFLRSNFLFEIEQRYQDLSLFRVVQLQSSLSMKNLLHTNNTLQKLLTNILSITKTALRTNVLVNNLNNFSDGLATVETNLNNLKNENSFSLESVDKIEQKLSILDNQLKNLNFCRNDFIKEVEKIRR